MIALVTTVLVGGVFLLSGTIKALNPLPFIRHIRKLNILPEKAASLSAHVFIQLEWAIGLALILQLSPEILILPIMMLLLGLTTISFWGIRSGRIAHCGCYGGALLVSPENSWKLNGFYLLLLGLAWTYPSGVMGSELWKIWVITAGLVMSNMLTKRSIGKPLLDLSPIQQGKRWQVKWVLEAPALIELESCLVVLLNQRCSECNQWIPLLNQLHQDGSQPEVIGILPILLPGQVLNPDLPQPVFPTYTIPRWKFNHLIAEPPHALLLEKGMITQTWLREFPSLSSSSILSRSSGGSSTF